MRKGYLLAKWHRRAETLHRKAVELAQEIEENIPKTSFLINSAGRIVDAAAELNTQLAQIRSHQ